MEEGCFDIQEFRKDEQSELCTKFAVYQVTSEELAESVTQKPRPRLRKRKDKGKGSRRSRGNSPTSRSPRDLSPVDKERSSEETMQPRSSTKPRKLASRDILERSEKRKVFTISLKGCTLKP